MTLKSNVTKKNYLWPSLSILQILLKKNICISDLLKILVCDMVADIRFQEGGVRFCGDAVLRYFSCGFAVIFILTGGIAVSKH